MSLSPHNLKFFKIDFNKDRDIAIQFRADSFIVSFGSDASFWGDDGKRADEYIETISARDPKEFGAFHVWMDEIIVGQVELGLIGSDKSWGYVYLYYLKPDKRGQGLAKYLDDFAQDQFLKWGVNRAKLSVSPNNERAIKFYQKRGWVDKGPRYSDQDVKENHMEQVHWMEKMY